jgi:hypothetical protein
MRMIHARRVPGVALLSLMFSMQAATVVAQTVDAQQTTDATQPIDAVEGPGGPDESPVAIAPSPEPSPTPVEELSPPVEPAPEVSTAPETTPAPTGDTTVGGVEQPAVDAGGTGGTDPVVDGTTAAEAPSLAQTIEEAGSALTDPAPVIEQSVVEETTKLAEVIAAVVSEVKAGIEESEETNLGTEIAVGESAATSDREGGGKTLSKARTTQAIEKWAAEGGSLLSNVISIFGSAQPSFAIIVDAMNDADGDGEFTDVEIAPAPGADVRFRAVISNIGSTSFEIAGVSHAYDASEGKVQVAVCQKLVGLVLLAGDSVPCTFSLAEYAPLRGESVVNTVTAAAFEIGTSKRGASDSDTSTVDTLLEDEVLAVAVSREPGVLAFTGMDAAGLIVLALTLLASGAALTQLSRRQRLREVPIVGDRWLELELLRWWDSNGDRPVPLEQISP